MEILVRGRNVEVDDALEAESRRKAGKLERLASDIRRIEVEFSEIRNPREHDAQQCEVVVHLTGNFVKAHGAAADLRSALDRATEKAEQQLGRVHSKRVSRTKPRHAPGEAGNGIAAG
jgi:ribosomal subunit interface protein